MAAFKEFPELHEDYRTCQVSSPHHSDVPWVPLFLHTRQNFQYKLYAAFGCKRIIRDQGYLQSLNRPNVRLTFDHIARVEPDGAVTATGMH